MTMYNWFIKHWLGVIEKGQMLLKAANGRKLWRSMLYPNDTKKIKSLVRVTAVIVVSRMFGYSVMNCFIITCIFFVFNFFSYFIIFHVFHVTFTVKLNKKFSTKIQYKNIWAKLIPFPVIESCFQTLL